MGLPNRRFALVCQPLLVALNLRCPVSNDLDLEEWESAIGKLILACSRVEYELIRLYEKWLPTRVYHKDSYFDRIDKAIGVAKRSLSNGDEIVKFLIEMRKFSEYRHMVAHNPVHYSNETGSWHIFDLKSNSISTCIDGLSSISKDAYIVSVKLAVLLRVNV